MKRSSISLSFLVLLIGTMSAALSWGQSSASSEALPTANVFTPPMAGPDLDPNNFGIQDGIDYWVPGPAFTPRSSSTIPSHDGFTGAVYFSSGTAPMVDGPVDLPNGAYVLGMRVFYYDNDPSNDISVWFTRYYGETSPSYEDLANFQSTGTPGWTSAWVDINHTIDLRDSSGNPTFYAVPVRFVPSASVNLKLKGVRLFWYRQVSPAPAVASFADVPTTHQFFQYIEALAASGITGGCGGGNFCPGNYVTRGQMAKFLATALGLHWPF